LSIGNVGNDEVIPKLRASYKLCANVEKGMLSEAGRTGVWEPPFKQNRTTLAGEFRATSEKLLKDPPDYASLWCENSIRYHHTRNQNIKIWRTLSLTCSRNMTCELAANNV
jgi:hypothetical protein